VIDASSFDVFEVDDLDCGFAPQPWPFAAARAAEIDAHWAELTRANPTLYNGRVLLQHNSSLEERDGRRILAADYLETDFKSFLAWRDFGYPERGVRNGFAMAALQSLDGAFLVGEMAAHTANAGRVYFPSGTPDRNDIRGDRVDLDGSAARELAEETGLGEADAVADPGWTLLLDPYRIACMKRFRAKLPAEVLAGRIHDFLAQDPRPELARMHIIRSPADFEGLDMPNFMLVYLRRALAEVQAG
jgi:8-oxo-dGTP pyrophosphatase MutT (NUDIX family)